MSFRPTQADVARKAGVSRGLVSLALSDSPRVNAETKANILRVASDMGYVRNQNAAFLSTSGTDLLGVVLPDLQNPFFEEVEDALRLAAEENKLLSLVSTARQDPEKEWNLINRYQEMQTIGVILTSPASSQERLAHLSETFPLAVLGLKYVAGKIDSIHMDEDAAARLAITHLAECGYDRIFSLSSPESVDQAVVTRRQAQRTAFEALRKNKKKFPGFQALLPDLEPGEQIRQCLEGSVAKRPAFIAHNNLIAIEACTALRALGMEPGKDCGLITYDDTYLGQLEEFSITSIDQHADQLGAQAVKAVAKRYAAPGGPGKEIAIRPSLLQRATTCKKPR
ncbi:sugar-binding domain protein [Varibaculum cambriense]|uniref:Sugar-binding domain protein n=1 Tax=Varibaculum cambriense TaxID=184870 RepID=A0AB34WXD1_9ACTO|nr:LacI family DNA-binding transcriptional regulator [Varibaculum cambriense]KXB79666.1 sugar-binding domain protein [Varibaculum cambriense]